MASGVAVGVTVVGVVAIFGLLGLLGRYLGVWTWAWAWIKATKEEKVQLCRSERTTSGRSYLLDNDLDWIGLWPRTGSYKRFTNLDDLSIVPSIEDETVTTPRIADQPDLPPQPLRPAPAPPPRIGGGWTDGEGSPSPASSMGGLGSIVETPPEPSRPAPVLDRRDSNRSLTGRIQRRDSSKELLSASQQGSPKRGSTNPFRASWIPPDESSEVTVSQETSLDVSASSSFSSSTGGGSRPFYYSSGGPRNIMEPERSLNGPMSYISSQENQTTTVDLLGYDTEPKTIIPIAKREEAILVQESEQSSVEGTIAPQPVGDLMFNEEDDLTLQSQDTPGQKMFRGNSPFDSGGDGGGGGGSSESNKISVGQKIFGSRSSPVEDEKVLGGTSVDGSDASIRYSEENTLGINSESTEIASIDKSKDNQVPESATTDLPDSRDSVSIAIDRNSYLNHHVDSVNDNSNSQISATENTYDNRNYTSQAYTDNHHEPKISINVSRNNANDVFSGSSSTSGDLITPSPIVNDNHGGSGGSDLSSTGDVISQLGGHTTTTTSISLPSTREPPVSPDLLGSYDIPDAPPNTATYVPASPHTPSRLAEVEARVRLLGERQKDEELRDTSQDWWPTEKTLKSTKGEQGLPPKISGGGGSVGGGGGGGGGGSGKEEVVLSTRSSILGSCLRREKGLSSVDEESVFLPDSESETDTTKSLSLGGGTSEETPAGEVESEEDASTRRVREYIASLSARLRQLPDDNSLSNSEFLTTPPTSASYPTTPPNSARMATEGSVDTPPNSATPYSPYNQPRSSSNSTPPSSSSGFRHLFGNRRASADASPTPVSPGIFNLSISRRFSLDTPPNSADLVTATPPNSASSQGVFGDTPPSSAGFSNTPPNSAGVSGHFDAGITGVMGQSLKRAMSCDSVSSDTSVTLGELEDMCGQVTGHLSIQLIYDR